MSGNGHININLDEDLTRQMTVYKNLTQEIIVTNTDKVKLILNDHHKIIRRKIEWVNPLGIFLSVLTTILTAKFEETKFGLSPQIWQAIFIVSCIASFAWSVLLVINAIRHYNKGTIDQFINQLKINNNNQIPPQVS
ncbi:MAG: hypothetical protein WCZ43_03545 [Proteiniphilum sp.]